MNWGRGFFRAWLVISAFWVGLAIYFEGPDTYNMHWLWRGPKIAYTTPSGFSGEFPLSRDRAALTKAAQTMAHPPSSKSVPAIPGIIPSLPPDMQ